MRTVFFIVLALAGILVGALCWNRAFPSAAIDFTISRSEARDLLQEHIAPLTGPLSEYRSVVRFGEDDTTKNFLERERGIPQLETLSREGLNVWYWTVRWFRPEQEEEFSASVDPSGRFVGYDHTIPEARAGPNLNPEAAREIAEDFLRRYAPHHPLETLDFLSASETKRPHRTDHTFVWKSENLQVGAAEYRLSVTVQGDAVGGYYEYLRVPENWRREFSRERKLNAFLQNIANAASAPIFLALLVLFVFYIARHRMRARDALPARWLLLAAAIALAAAVSDVPSMVAGYATTEKWGSYLFENISSALLGVLTAVAGVWFLALVADPLYREMCPEKLSFREALGRGALRRPEVLRSLGIGIAFACFAFGYVSLFYVVATHLGAWSPVEIDYVKTLSGWMPWVSGMQVGFSAAWSEEILFRVLAILVYWKIFRLRWLAVLLSAATWGFLHSNYPQMPGYLRGLELTLVGILWGVLFLRYGLVTTLTAHYLYDCWLSSLIVLRSPSWIHVAGALAVSLWPVALWLRALWLQRRGEVLHAVEVAETESIPPPSPPEECLRQRWDFSPVRLSRRARWLLFLGGAAALVGTHFLPLPQEGFTRLGGLELSRSEITTRAAALMEERGFDPATYHSVVTVSAKRIASRYLLEHGSLDRLSRLFGQEWPEVRWRVRYFRFNEREEFVLTLDKYGHLVRWNHIIPQEAAGASLAPPEALALATKTLARESTFEADKEELVRQSPHEEANRRDFDFTFRRIDWGWGEAQLRTHIRLQGDEPVRFSRWVKIPEKWQREHRKSGWREALLGEGSSWMSAGFAAFFGFVLVLMIQRGVMPWKISFLLALVPATFSLLLQLNQIPFFFSGYTTTTPPAFYIAQTAGGWLLGLVLTYVGAVFQIAVTLGLVRWAFGWTLRDLHLPFTNTESRIRYGRQLLAIATAALGAWALRTWLGNFYCGHLLPSWVASVSLPSVDSALPFLNALVWSLQNGWEKLLHVGLYASGFVLIHRRWPRVAWTLLLGLPVLMAVSQDSPAAFFYGVFYHASNWLLLFLLVWKLWRFDVWTIFATYALHSLLSSTTTFLIKGGPTYAWQALPLLLALALPLLLAIRLPGRGGPPPR